MPVPTRPLRQKIAPVLLALTIAVGCNAKDQPPPDAAKKPAPATPTREDRRAELLAQASSEAEAGNVEAAISAYFKVEKFGELADDEARAFATLLKTNGDAVVANGDEVARGMANYAKAILVDPNLDGLVEALVNAAKKQDDGGGLYSEDVVQSFIDENKPGDAAKPMLAQFFRQNAERLIGESWTTTRLAANVGRATTLAPDLPGLGETRQRVTDKGASEVVEAAEIKAHYDKLFAKDPSKDVYELVAKRREMTKDDVLAAVELAGVTEQQRSQKLATEVEAECGPKPSCGGLDGGCQGDESAFKNPVEVSNCTTPRLVEGQCWVVRCEVNDERSGRALGQYELAYKAVDGVPMPISADPVGG